MLRAGTLFLVVVIALIISILTGSYILATYYNNMAIQKNLLYERLEANSVSSINLLLADPDTLGKDETRIVDLFGDQRDSVLLVKKTWGIFGVLGVKAFANRDTVKKALLIGYKPGLLARAAIYLPDQNRPLSVCGRTQITGTAYLPDAGAKRGYIEGMGYASNTLVNGDIKQSNTAVPLLHANILAPIVQGLAPLASGQANVAETGTNYLAKDTLFVSFLQPTVMISTNTPVDFSRKNWKGNIIFSSSVPVAIRQGTILSEVQIFAPSIIVENQFTGSAQLFANDSILIGTNCVFNYPSAIGLVKNNVKTYQQFIRLQSNSTINGIVFTSLQVTDRTQARISIDENAVVRGQLYTDGFAEVKGTVWGNVTCNKFYLRTNSSVYENYVLNAVINAAQLPLEYVGSSLLPSEKYKRVVKWLF
jgi:hypothetical protein